VPNAWALRTIAPTTERKCQALGTSASTTYAVLDG
jgi:hypothetical protein